MQPHHIRLLIVLVTFLVWAVVGLQLSACAPIKPAPVELGEEIRPPAGCIEGRKRGVDC